MKLIYTNFDTIAFAVKGALKPQALEYLRRSKERAIKEQADQLIQFEDVKQDVFIKSTGQKNGYAFVLDMGFDAQTISLKDNLGLVNWNGFVKIRAMNLAINGYDKAVEDALKALNDIGFVIKGVSVNRVDYAMDVLTSIPIEIDPECVVTHSRRQVKTHYDPITTVIKARQVQSLTIGKMPGSQIIIYDKLAEVKAKRNNAWFKIWGIDPHADNIFIKRVEIRAGKEALKAFNITSLKDLSNRIGPALRRLITATRYVETSNVDSVVSRRANHPLWNRITNHLETEIQSNESDINSNEIKIIMKEGKAKQYQDQILGNFMGYANCIDVPFEDILDVLKPITAELRDMMLEGSYKQQHYGKKYIQVKGRLRF